jgi:Asp-tRNA(Asn)/Glu-tRNA(Gln) amidotransferase A subunit family amidase
MPATEVWSTFLQWRHWLTMSSLRGFYDRAESRGRLKAEAVWEIEHGLAMTAREVSTAMESRDRWFASVSDLLQDYEFILAPAAQVFPFGADEHWPVEIDGRPMDTYHRWMETAAPWSLTSLPIAALPAGFGDAQLPTGVQLIGRNHADLDVLRLANAYDEITNGRVATRPSQRHGLGQVSPEKAPFHEPFVRSGVHLRTDRRPILPAVLISRRSH